MYIVTAENVFRKKNSLKHLQKNGKKKLNSNNISAGHTLGNDKESLKLLFSF